MSVCSSCFSFFFFKQKTSYEMRISDWSSDVCSSDLSVFVSPLDAKIPAIMESVFYIAEPATNDSLKQQFRDDLSAFRHDRNAADALDTSTTEEIGRASCRERVWQYV